MNSKSLASNTVQAIIASCGIVIGLWWPDLDLLALQILHHRSIVTHSILLPIMLMLVIRNKFPSNFLGGLFGGIGIHLTADSLSAVIGFGTVWTPAPLKLSLGLLSPPWLIINAFVGTLFAIRTMTFQKPIVISMLLLSALAYSYLNERSLVPFVAYLAMIFCLLVFVRRSERLRDWLVK